MDYLKQLAEKLMSPFLAFKEAVASKKFKNILVAVRDLVRQAVLVTEDLTAALKEAGVVLESKEKHGMVVDYVMDVAIQQINDAIDVPFINEEQEEWIFRMILNVLIHQAVRFFNKYGWS